jgi:hypothetical protein
MKTIYKTAGYAAWLQLIVIFGAIIASFVFGNKPPDTKEFFALIEQGKLPVLIQDDFIYVILIALYLLTFPGLYFALRKQNHAVVLYACLFTFIAATLAFSSNTAFSMMYLADQYMSAESPELQAQYLAAGEALIAGNMWNSTAAYMAGMLLQGGGVMISLVMLRSGDFFRITAIAGILGNGLDLIQHLAAPFYPAIHDPVIMLAGPFYLLWFTLTGWNLLKLARNTIST